MHVPARSVLAVLRPIFGSERPRFRVFSGRFKTAALACALALGGPAHAGNFKVSPTRVVIDDKHQSVLITVDNNSNAPIRFEVTAEAWSEALEGGTLLEPTDDLVVFPTLLTVGPNSSRRLRIGATAASTDIEQSYRVFVTELPPLQRHAPEGVSVLTRMGIPVFIEPRKVVKRLEVAEVTVDGNDVAVAVDNVGTVHGRVSEVTITGREKGKQTFTASTRGWYVLADSRRVFRLDIPVYACKEADEIHVRLETHLGPSMRTVPLTPQNCTP